MKGRTGWLRAGSRPVTTFTRWSMVPMTGNGEHMRVSVQGHTPTSYWDRTEAGDVLTIKLDVGKGVWAGTATILGREPLEIEMEGIHNE